MRREPIRNQSNPHRALFIGTVLIAALGLVACSGMRTTDIEYTETERSVMLGINDYTGEYLYTEDFENDGDVERFWAANLDDGPMFYDKVDWEGDEVERSIGYDYGDEEIEYTMELDDDGDHEVELEHEMDDYELEHEYDYDPTDDGTSRFDIEKRTEIETDEDEVELGVGVEPDDYEYDVEVDTAALEYDEDFDAEDGEEIEWDSELESNITGNEYDNEFEYEIDDDEIEREVDYETASGSIELQEELEEGEYDLELEGMVNGEVVDVEREGTVVERPVRTATVTEVEVDVYEPVTRKTVLVEPDEKPEVFVLYLSGADDIFAACGIASKEAYFRLDSSNLTAKGQRRLSKVADCLTSGPLKGAKLEVIGYADPRASNEYNLELAAERATSVADFLSAQGVPRSKIDTLSEGESEAHTDPALWPYDRRVELRIDRSAL